MKKLLSSVIAAAAFVALPAQAAPFINGSFETGPAPGSFTILGNGSTAISGWTVGGNSIDYIGSLWQHADGLRSIDLSGNGAGSLAQSFDTVAGTRYRVTFAIAGNPDGGPVVKTGTVDATGGAVSPFTFDTTGTSQAAMGWTPLSYFFTASSASSTLTFTSTTAGFFGPTLDNVSVSAIPEPATWAMMIMGFGLIGAALRRAKPKVNVASA